MLVFKFFSSMSLHVSAEDRCRHFMINAVEDGYVIVGENRCHRRLQDLVDFHRKYPMMLYNEVLTVACGQVRKCFYLHTGALT